MAVSQYAKYKNTFTRERVRVNAIPSLLRHLLKPSSAQICTDFRLLRIL